MTKRDKVSFLDLFKMFEAEYYLNCSRECDGCEYAMKYSEECPYSCPMQEVQKMIESYILPS